MSLQQTFEAMRANLNRHSYSLRQATSPGLFYATGSDNHSYAIRWSNQLEQWICNPISGNNQRQADEVLEIALGKRRLND